MTEADNSHWIGVRLTKHRTETRNLVPCLQIKFFAENFDIALDPVDAY